MKQGLRCETVEEKQGTEVRSPHQPPRARASLNMQPLGATSISDSSHPSSQGCFITDTLSHRRSSFYDYRYCQTWKCQVGVGTNVLLADHNHHRRCIAFMQHSHHQWRPAQPISSASRLRAIRIHSLLSSCCFHHVLLSTALLIVDGRLWRIHW